MHVYLGIKLSALFGYKTNVILVELVSLLLLL